MNNVELKQDAHPSEKWILFILIAANFTHIMDFVVIAPLNPFLKEALAIDSTQFGILVSSYTFSAGIAGLIAFFKFDAYDRRKMLLFLYAGFVFGNFLCAIAPGYKFFLLSRIIAGAFGGVLSVLIFSVIGDVIPAHRRGKAIGMVMAAFSGASVLGIPLGLFLTHQFDFHAPFILLTGISIVMFGVIWKKFPSLTLHFERKAADHPSRKELLWSFLASSNVRNALALTFFLTLAGFMVVPFVSDYMVNNVGLDKNMLGYIYFFGGLATAVTGPWVGRMADKHGVHKVFVLCAAISMLPLFLITNLPPLEVWFLFPFTTLFFISFGSRFVPAVTLVTACVSPRVRGSFMSINTATQQFASAIAAMASGLIVSNTPDGKIEHFWVVGICAVAFTIISLIVSYRVKEVS